jgi:hypothetical protein
MFGSGRDAYVDFKNGNYVGAAFNAAMAVSDIFLVKGLVVAGGKVAAGTAFKTSGSHVWKTGTRPWLRKTGQAKPRQEIHHWLFHQNEGIGKHVPEFIKNQPWNLMPMPLNNPAFHQALHGKGPLAKTLLGRVMHSRLVYGSPTWAKSVVGYGANSIENTQRE